MKKLISIIGLVSMTLVSQGQVFQTRQFLNVQNLYVSNAVTFVTNLNSSASIGTNLTGVTFTNNIGNLVNGASANYVNVLKTINLWTPTLAPYIIGPSTNATIFIRFGGGGAAATNAVSFEFVPVPNGVNESTTTGDAFVITTTAVTAVTNTTLLVPFPSSKYPGVSSLMLRKIYSVPASVADSHFNIKEVSLNGFVP